MFVSYLSPVNQYSTPFVRVVHKGEAELVLKYKPNIGVDNVGHVIVLGINAGLIIKVKLPDVVEVLPTKLVIVALLVNDNTVVLTCMLTVMFVRFALLVAATVSVNA